MSHWGDSIEEYRIRYLNQVGYLHKQLIKTVDAIQLCSEQPPVIVILSDYDAASGEWLNDLSHPESGQRFGVLCTLSPQGVDAHDIPDNLGAVNVFRLTFNHYSDTAWTCWNRSNSISWENDRINYIPVELPKTLQSEENGKALQAGGDIGQPGLAQH